ncbi:MAG: PqiC family protein [Candidatus Omnitrophica bacterium]|nr:PqiC family protein [Candidatus Omnitrophota bacterium]
MREISSVCRKIMICVVFVLLLNGCMSIPNSPNPRFYTLFVSDSGQADKKFDIAADTIVGIGPIRIPEYLDRPQMVTIEKDKTMKFAQFDRWAGPLDLNLGYAIRENLVLLLPQASFTIYPWNLSLPVKYQVVMDIIQLDAELQKNLTFVAQWSVIDANDGKMLLIKRSEFRLPIGPQSYFGIAKTLSFACASLSSEIAEALVAVSSQAKTETPVP